jgi:hypothetical protein
MFEMKYRVRTFVGTTPILDHDMKTDSLRTAMRDVADRIEAYGADDVSLKRPGMRPIRGDELLQWLKDHA